MKAIIVLLVAAAIFSAELITVYPYTVVRHGDLLVGSGVAGVSNSKILALSTDSVTWTAVVWDFDCHSIRWLADRFVAVGTRKGSTYTTVAYVVDDSTWGIGNPGAMAYGCFATDPGVTVPLSVVQSEVRVVAGDTNRFVTRGSVYWWNVNPCFLRGTTVYYYYVSIDGCATWSQYEVSGLLYDGLADWRSGTTSAEQRIVLAAVSRPGLERFYDVRGRRLQGPPDRPGVYVRMDGASARKFVFMER